MSTFWVIYTSYEMKEVKKIGKNCYEIMFFMDYNKNLKEVLNEK